MTLLGFIIIIIVILIAGVWLRKEGFEAWPIPTPEQIGQPTPPAIMNFEERVAKGEITPPVISSESKPAQQQNVISSQIPTGGFMFPQGPYPMYGYQQGVYGMYGPYGQYASLYSPYSPLSFGGNSSGSTVIGGFGPPLPSGQVTPASVRGSADMMSALSSQPALAALASQSPKPVESPQSVQSEQSAPADTSLRATIAAIGGGGSRAKAVRDEVDIQGFDWAGLAAQSAAAYEPTQTTPQEPVTISADITSPFETVAASQVLQRTTLAPNITASTALSLPTITVPTIPTVERTISLPNIPSLSLPQRQIDALNQQKFAQTMFGSVQTPPLDISGLIENKNYIPVNDMSTAPLFSANAPVIGVRGSKNQPGNILNDPKSTQTVIDNASQVNTALNIIQQPGVAGTSSVSA